MRALNVLEGAKGTVYLRRKIDRFLLDWKADSNRKPLIVKGSRQVGKTAAIRHFASANYRSVVEINFVENPKYRAITQNGYSVDEVVKSMSLLDPTLCFIPHETLIFFDEIQDHPDIATTLKFFRQDGRFDVICSGSMLGINYRTIESNSVGYKTDYEMHSLDFEEFLWAKGYDSDTVESMFGHLASLRPFLRSRWAHSPRCSLTTAPSAACLRLFLPTLNAVPSKAP